MPIPTDPDDISTVNLKYRTYNDVNNADFQHTASQIWRKYNGDDVDATLEEYRAWVKSIAEQ